MLAILIIVIAIFYAYLKWNNTYWKRKNIPGPEPTIFIGNIGQSLSMKKNFGLLSKEWYEKYSSFPYIGYYRCLTPTLMIRDPDLVRDILVKDFLSFEKNDVGFTGESDPLILHNPFVVSGEKWQRARSLLSQLFTSNKIKQIFPFITICCDRFENHIKLKGEKYDFDSKTLAAQFTTENSIMCGFTINSESFDNPKSEFREMGKKMFKPSTWIAIKFMLLMFFPSLVKLFRMSFLEKEVDIWIRNLVKSCLKSRETVKLPQDDFLQMLLQQKEKQNLSLEEITGHSLSFFTEGYETSSALLCFAMYEMARNPDFQTKLFEEVVEVLSQKNGQISFEAIQEMTYLDAVMHETLRLRPIGFTMNKSCTKTYNLPPMPGHPNGFLIQPGMSIAIPVLALHHDPSYYDDPETFDPSRFTNEMVRKNIPKGAYLPFGDGPRMCMGMRFALTQTKAALITAIKSFEIKLSSNSKPFELDQSHFLYQSKNPLLLNFVPRTNT